MSQIHATLFCGTEHHKSGPYWTQEESEGKIARVENFATHLCGGCTITRTTGAWKGAKGVVRERAVRFDVLCSNREQALSIARYAKEVFDQYSVLLETQLVEGEFV